MTESPYVHVSHSQGEPWRTVTVSIPCHEGHTHDVIFRIEVPPHEKEFPDAALAKAWRHVVAEIAAVTPDEIRQPRLPPLPDC